MSDFSTPPKPNQSTASFSSLPAGSTPKPNHDDAPAPRSQDDIDRELDQAIDAKIASKATPDVAKPLKKQFDDEIEAELNAFLNAFDTGSLEAALPVPKGTPRPKVAEGVKADAAAKPEEPAEPKEKGKSGKIIKISKDWVFIDMGGKSEGCLPVSQLEGKEYAVGDEIPVTIERFDSNEGLLILSMRGAAISADWETLKTGQIVEAIVTKTNKGGLEVTVNNLRAFLPVSQIEIGRVEDTSAYLGQRFKAVVTEVNPRLKNLVVSRRDFLEQERAEKREQTLAELAEGQTREGVVRSIREFGAFVDLGGVDGLLHIGDMAWTRVQKPEDIVRIGDHVSVKVLKMDPEKKRISLGLKQLVKSPWEKLADDFSVGSTVSGKVTRIQEFGAFVELVPGVEGLVHVSELSPNRVRRVADIVKAGQEVEVQILSIDADQQRVSLSMKAVHAAREEAALDAADAAAEAAAAAEPQKPKPERKVPLKGGLGGGGPLFKL